ncbi:hypothetical protein RhiJN_07930 [Ceratobasidium sp. AG-Ba]|nr:hypothetical protein RhiJN_07930 [Ceratobasidium sp. AG-Ba]
MSSPLASPNGPLQPFPSVESEPAAETTPDSTEKAVQDVTSAAAHSTESRLIDEARHRLEDKCTPDDDLRDSLAKLVELCQTLTSRVQSLEPQIVDLQTTLTLTQSNLTLSLANTEMLEDALRSNSQSRDVGWRRSDSTARRPVAASVSYPSAAEQATIVVQAPSPAKANSGASTPTSPPIPSESRFFKFRFGSKSPSPTSPAYSLQQTQPTHLTSASLPSLGLTPEEETRAKQVDELASQQAALKLKASEIDTRHQELVDLEKKIKAREEEVEKLLKEREAELDKANNMVATERRRMAEVEALLKETEEERDAVRGAMRVIEGENGRLRELSSQSRTSGESARALPDEPLASEPSRIPTLPRPESSHSSHEGDRSILEREEAPTPIDMAVDTAESANASMDSLPAVVPGLLENSPDPWKARAPSTSPPKTPPRVHALPTETSPWAENRTSA